MSVVRDLFKLRKYNIREVNEQIHRSQNSTRTGNGKRDQGTIDNKDITTTGSNHTCSNTTKVEQARAESQEIKEHQEKSQVILNETACPVDSSTKDAKDVEKSSVCES